MSLRRIAPALALALGASPVLAAVAYSPCADFISSRVNDVPVAGELVGWAEITTTWSWGHTSRSETRYEGYYNAGGRMIRVDCETYAQIA
jgi:hypothetical protein